MAIKWTAEELKAACEEYAKAIGKMVELTIEERKQAFLNACLDLAEKITENEKE